RFWPPCGGRQSACPALLFGPRVVWIYSFPPPEQLWVPRPSKRYARVHKRCRHGAPDPFDDRRCSGSGTCTYACHTSELLSRPLSIRICTKLCVCLIYIHIPPVWRCNSLGFVMIFCTRRSPPTEQQHNDNNSAATTSQPSHNKNHNIRKEISCG